MPYASLKEFNITLLGVLFCLPAANSASINFLIDDGNAGIVISTALFLKDRFFFMPNPYKIRTAAVQAYF